MNNVAITDIRAEMKRMGLIFMRLLVSANPGREPWEQTSYVNWNFARSTVYRIEYVRAYYNDGSDADIKEALNEMLCQISQYIHGVSHSRSKDGETYRLTFTI